MKIDPKAIITFADFVGKRLSPKWITFITFATDRFYREIWLAGEERTGKTTAAIFGALYDLYRLQVEKKNILPASSFPLAFVFNNELVKSAFDLAVKEIFGDLKGWMETLLVRKPEELNGRAVCGAILTKPDEDCKPEDWVLIREQCTVRAHLSFGKEVRIWFDASDKVIENDPMLKAFQAVAHLHDESLVIKSRKHFKDADGEEE